MVGQKKVRETRVQLEASLLYTVSLPPPMQPTQRSWHGKAGDAFERPAVLTALSERHAHSLCVYYQYRHHQSALSHMTLPPPPDEQGLPTLSPRLEQKRPRPQRAMIRHPVACTCLLLAAGLLLPTPSLHPCRTAFCLDFLLLLEPFSPPLRPRSRHHGSGRRWHHRRT